MLRVPAATKNPAMAGFENLVKKKII